MFLLAGLGNPGREYAATRHNVGFMLADRLAEAGGVKFGKSGSALIAKGMVFGAQAVLIKPQTYMNLSGQAVAEFVSFYKIDAGSLLVFYDDCDLPLGKIRLRKDGGSGGHKGVESIISALGSKDFPRLRLGIGRPANLPDSANPDGPELKDYVLTPFTCEEGVIVDEMLGIALDAVKEFMTHGIDVAMNGFN
ncbi:MAG: aminoacyl-tRNA hydrolase [Deltaproteobacteria bacterium]|nr:aminoacyl-tRNA hydrolase [Deltaproteobacteria bacterium]